MTALVLLPFAQRPLGHRWPTTALGRQRRCSRGDEAARAPIDVGARVVVIGALVSDATFRRLRRHRRYAFASFQPLPLTGNDLPLSLAALS